MGEGKLPTYFIKNASKMESPKLIRHWNQHKNIEESTENWLPEGPAVVGVTAGASCPNNLIEDILHKLYEFRGVKVISLLPDWAK